MSAYCLALLLPFIGAQERVEEVNYATEVRPLFAEKCAACHGAIEQEVGLRLDAGSLIHQGSDSGPVIEPGNAIASLLMERVRSEDVDLRMPPEGEGEPLTDLQLSLLERWIDSGAKFPEEEAIPPGPEDHWAYRRPERPTVPELDNSKTNHPIDVFVRDQQLQQGLKPAVRADSLTRLRRLYLDLTGLPPTREQIEAFRRDDSAPAWESLIDQLLESPHYGERWGRHWMDVWRYSDWDGYKNELRGSQRHIWRWRDWIVQSLNEDKGYDQMIVEMLAGDEVAPDDVTVLPATGFLARNFHKSNRNIWLDATVEHTSKAFLGVTLNCARCHDHKYDPIAQSAYYQFRAIFEPHQVRTDRIPGQLDVMKDGIPRAFDANLDAKTFVYQNGNEKHPIEEHPMTAGVPSILGGVFEIEAVELPQDSFFPGLREFVVEERLRSARARLRRAEQELETAASDSATEEGGASDSENLSIQVLRRNRAIAELEVRSLEARRAADLSRAADPNDSPDPELATAAAALKRQLALENAELALIEKQIALESAVASEEADEQKKQQAVAKAEMDVAEAQKARDQASGNLTNSSQNYDSFDDQFPRTSTGRRLALAKWIVSEQNPLTARVAVNHIWMRHFGTPLVENVFDFGMRSPTPSHIDLLDWLAVELMENDWSMKHIHKLILTSQTWQQASTVAGELSEHNRAIDPDNLYYWRANVDRLDAEIVRDSLLAVSGRLDKTVGGPEIDYRQGEETQRRSIYIRHAYEKQMKMLVLFDAASPNECYRRSESIIPQQALALANSSLSINQSRRLAAQLWTECQDRESPEHAFVRESFLQILTREPSDSEAEVCLTFLSDQAELLSDPSRLQPFSGGTAPEVKPSEDPAQRARENLVLVLFNHNDFVNAR